MTKPLILVLCTGNSARSQMAEGFLRKYLGDQYEIASAGTAPAPRVNPNAVTVMKEIGIDISSHYPKLSGDFLGKKPVKHVLIVCDNANNTCPTVWPGAFSRTFMPFEDPAAVTGSESAQLEAFRKIRDQIDEKLKNWKPAIEKAQ